MFRMLLLKDDIFQLRHKQLMYIRHQKMLYIRTKIMSINQHTFISTLNEKQQVDYSTDNHPYSTLRIYSCLIVDDKRPDFCDSNWT